MAEDTTGIPIDKDQLRQFVEQDQPEKDKQEPKQEPKQKTDDLDLGQFKNPKDMLKSYKEIQGAFTRTTQELKELKEEREKLKEQLEMNQYKAPSSYNNQQTLAPQTEDFDSMLAEDPRKAIESVVANTARTMRIAEVLEELQEEDDKAFSARYSYAQTLSQNPQYAHLANSPVGVRKLFKLGDKLREQEVKTNASKQLEVLLGGPVDEQKIAKLREMLGTGQTKQQPQTQLGNVYMPDTSDTYRPGTDAQTDLKRDYDEKARKAEQDGDIDGVIEAAFGKALSE